MNTLINDEVQRKKNSLAHVQIENGNVFCWTSEDGNSLLGQKYDNDLNPVSLLFTISSTSKPTIPELFKTTGGFGVVFTNMGDEILTRFYNNECQPITNEIKVNGLQNINSNQDEQKLIIEVNNGYLIVWCGKTNATTAESINAQILDNNFNKFQSQFQISKSSIYDQFNPSFMKMENGNFIICWGTWAPNNSGTATTQIMMQQYSGDVVPINEQIIISNNKIMNDSRYVKIIETENHYHICWISIDTMFLYIQKLKKTLELENDIETIQSQGLLDIHSISNEIAIVRYENNRIKLQRYFPNYVIISTERIINDDVRNDFIDSFAIVTSISNGYMIAWNSTKICQVYTLFARQYYPPPQTVDQDTQALILDVTERAVTNSVVKTEDSINIVKTNLTTADIAVLSKKDNRQATVDTLLAKIEDNDTFTDKQKKNVLIDTGLIFIPPEVNQDTQKVKLIKIQESTASSVALDLDIRELVDPIYVLMKNVDDKIIITGVDIKISIIKNKNDYTVNILDNNNEIIQSEDRNKDDTITINDKVIVLGSSIIGKYQSLNKTLSGGATAQGFGFTRDVSKDPNNNQGHKSVRKLKRTSRACARACDRSKMKVVASGAICKCVAKTKKTKK